MNICVISSSDERHGGYLAGVRLTKSLRQLGHNCIMLVADKQSDDPWVKEVGSYGYWINKLIRKSCQWFDTYQSENEYYFDLFNDRIGVKTFSWKKCLPFKVDAFIVTWTKDFLSVSQLSKLWEQTGVPIVLYLMDMSPLTGGCHYSWGCEAYITGCKACPALPSDKIEGRAWNSLRRKYSIIQPMNITIAAPTKMLADQARYSMLFKKKRIEKIALSVDPDIFHPGSKESMREILGLPKNKKIIYFAANTKEKRKGARYFIKALQELKAVRENVAHEVFILTAGLQDMSSEISGMFDNKHLGVLRDDGALADSYQAADMFVCPSIEDAGPMMINEAVMCGLPVVSFGVGVAFDLVHTGITGYRAENRSPTDLAAGIISILNLSEAEYRKMSNKCREVAFDVCHPHRQVRRFELLLESIIGEGL